MHKPIIVYQVGNQVLLIFKDMLDTRTCFFEEDGRWQGEGGLEEGGG